MSWTILNGHCGVIAYSTHSPYYTYGSLRASALPCTDSLKIAQWLEVAV
jgi:hypothetical protein